MCLYSGSFCGIHCCFRKLNLLSFGEEAEEEEKQMAAIKHKIKSSHDVLDDPRLLKEEESVIMCILFHQKELIMILSGSYQKSVSVKKICKVSVISLHACFAAIIDDIY